MESAGLSHHQLSGSEGKAAIHRKRYFVHLYSPRSNQRGQWHLYSPPGGLILVVGVRHFEPDFPGGVQIGSVLRFLRKGSRKNSVQFCLPVARNGIHRLAKLPDKRLERNHLKSFLWVFRLFIQLPGSLLLQLFQPGTGFGHNGTALRSQRNARMTLGTFKSFSFQEQGQIEIDRIPTARTWNCIRHIVSF